MGADSAAREQVVAPPRRPDDVDGPAEGLRRWAVVPLLPEDQRRGRAERRAQVEDLPDLDDVRAVRPRPGRDDEEHLPAEIDARHLRTFLNAAGRQAALVEQLVAPGLRSRNPERRKNALEDIEALARASQELSHLLFTRDLRATVERTG